MPLPNPGMNFTPFDPLPASDLNDIVENIESLADGTGFDAGSLGANPTAINAGATGTGFYEIGRTTLASAGDTITVTGFAARKYLRITAALPTSGSIQPQLKFNNDSGSNYEFRRSSNGAAESTSTSSTVIPLTAGTAGAHVFVTIETDNVAARQKLVIAHSTRTASPPDRDEVVGRWNNTSAQITRIDIINAGTGDFAIGSEVVVLGHD